MYLSAYSAYVYLAELGIVMVYDLSPNVYDSNGPWSFAELQTVMVYDLSAYVYVVWDNLLYVYDESLTDAISLMFV